MLLCCGGGGGGNWGVGQWGGGYNYDHWCNNSWHTENYCNGFSAQQQQQTSSQGASINIYGNNYGSASIGQSSDQGQGQSQSVNPLRVIGQGLCNLAGGCYSSYGAPGPGGYGGQSQGEGP